jgi:flagellar biosynthesis protein FlhB
MTDKSYAPTQKKLQKARTDGNICKSPSLTAIFAVTIGFCSLFLLSNNIWEYLIFLVKLNGYQNQNLPVFSFKGLLLITLFWSGFIITPYIGAALLADFGQLGWKIVPQNLLKDKEQNCFSRYFSSFVENIKSLWIPILTLVVLAYCGWKYRFQFSNTLYCLIFLLWIFAVLDFYTKKFFWYKNMMMSHQELKDEYKDSEGDPHAKAYRSAVQRSIAMQSLEQRVRRAKVIVVGTNVKTSERTRRNKGN